MADSLSEADKIRNKRLAKLSNPTPSQNGEADRTSDGPSNPPTNNIPTQPSNITTTASSEAAVPPELGSKSIGGNNNNRSASPSSVPSKRNHQASSSMQAASTPQESLQTWEDRTLSNFFRLTLNAEQKQDLHGNSLYFLKDLRSELEQDGQSLKFHTALLDQAILEASSNLGGTPPLDYLLACWKRISRTFRSMRKGDTENPKYTVIKEARRLCMSYCIFAVTIPDMFGLEPTTENPLTKHLLADPDSDRGLCHDFMSEAVSRFPEDESIKFALVEALEQLSQDLRTKSMNDDYKPYVNALRGYVRYPAMVLALTESPSFLPLDVAAQDLEKDTLLGPFFRLSPMQGEVAMNYFSNPRSRDRGYIVNSQNALRMTLQTHQSELFDIVDRFIKSSKDSRERLLDWFAATVNKNHKRRAIRVDPRYVSTDGFMVNVTVCLDKLCEPFMDTTFSKIDRVEAEYFRRSPRVDISDETKINADQSKADEFYAQKAEGTSTFISEVFFLTAAAHHYGTEAANTKLESLRRELRHMDKQIEKFEEERNKYLSNPAQLAQFDRAFQKYKDECEKGHCVFHAIQGMLLDELSQQRSMSFMRYIIVWLMRMVSGIDFPKKRMQLPLPVEQPEVFNCLPEYFVEDVVDHFKFMTSHMPHVITSTQCDELVMFSITCLRSTDYIKNPFLKSGLVTILFYGVMPVSARGRGILVDVLNALPFALDHLLHALMQFYIDCEVTGAHTQFYDKFNIRYEIFQVIKAIWSNSIYRENLSKEAKHNLDFFVRFVNLLLNDVTFVLDESFTAFNQISSLTRELRDHKATMDEQTVTQKEEALEAAQSKAKSYMSLTNETVQMFKLFTDALADSFTIPEVVQRLADMLDYNLDALVGPKQTNLRVDNPAEYNFDPKRLLGDIVDVYLNLSHKHEFHVAVARDGRSYKPGNFGKAANILSKYAVKSNEELERWNKLCEVIEKVKAEEEEEEQDLGEIPDDFADPLMATLMTDPVILPISRAVMDRSTIRQHLLSDPHDPYSRAPLKIEDVIDDTDLKTKIETWKAEKKAQRRAERSASDQNKMDTD